jgi:serine/threonine protein phosphatase PrpC
MADIDRKNEWLRSRASREKDIENLARALFEARSTPVFAAGISDQNVKRFLSDEDLNFLAFSFIADVEALWKSKFISLQTLESKNAPPKTESAAIDAPNKESVSQSVASKINPNQSAPRNSLSSSAITQGAKLSTMSDVSNTNKPVTTADVLKQRQASAANSAEVTEYNQLGARTKLDQQNTTKNSDSKEENAPTSKTTTLPVSTASPNSQTTANQHGSQRATNQVVKAQIQKELSHPSQAKSSDSSSTPLPQSKNSQAITPGVIPAAGQPPAVVPKVLPTFHLPNCNVGKHYSNLLEAVHKSGKKIIVHTVDISSDLGLVFDPSSQTVMGVPKLDGEFNLSLSWSFDTEQEKSKGTCHLTSNPDPKSLWKVNEPPNDSIYQKDHLDNEFLVGSGIKIIAASRRGRSHEHAGTFRDDDFFIAHDKNANWNVMIVSDGAGSAQFSREGARIAVTCAGKFLKEHLFSKQELELEDMIRDCHDASPAKAKLKEFFHYLFFRMAQSAILDIEAEAKNKNNQFKDYSTTLLVSVSKKIENDLFVASFWVGDGAIAVYQNSGAVKLLGTPDSGEFAGQTRFLDGACLTKDFPGRINVDKFKNDPALILMTDGVSDPFFETDNGLIDPARWALLWKELIPVFKSATADTTLLDWLHFFKPGHHDDRTIAILWS